MAKILAIIGKIAFVAGILFAIFGGIWGGKSVPTNETVIIALLASGVVIGLLNITAREAPAILMAAVAFIILGIWSDTRAFLPVYQLSQALAENLVGVVSAFALLMAPAAIIIAIKAVISAAQPG